MDAEHITIPYKPLPYQKIIHDDQHRFKVIVVGRRAGKTTLSINQIIKWALERNLAVPYWYIAPYEYQAKEIAWRMLLKYVPSTLWSKKPTETNLTVYLLNGARISLKGGNNPWGLEGVALGGLIVDEVAAFAEFRSLWQYTLRPMLTDYRSPALFISKPRSFNFFHELAKMGDHSASIEGELPENVLLDNEFNTYRLTTEINCREHFGGYLPHAEIENAQKQLSPEAFDQEYMARFVTYSGLVNKLFSRDTHVIADFNVPREWHRLRGFDFGSAHPTASIRIAVDPDNNWFVESCYKVRDKSIDDHASYLMEEDRDVGGSITGYGDPSGRQWIKEFNIKGLNIVPAKKQKNTSEKNWLQLGIDVINSKLQPREGHIVLLTDGRKIKNAPSFFILNRPQNRALVEELETLTYKEENGINKVTIDDARDRNGHYDLHASLRYAMVSEAHGTISYMLVDPVGDKKKEEAELAKKLTDPEARKRLELNADLALMKKAQQDARW